MLTYVCGVIILARLFSLQIINGADYRQSSNTRISREALVEATRGNILDRNGTSLVSSEMTFALEMYKSKTDDASLNSSISLMTLILQNNNDSYCDNFPISIEPFEFHFNSDEKLAEWKKAYKIPETASAEEAFYLFRDKYNIDSEDIKEIRRILAIRYEITTKGYSVTKSISIAKSISRSSAIQLQESSSELTGVNVIIESKRLYNMGSLASHIIGYMGRIREGDKQWLDSLGDTYKYEPDNKVGQNGIEKVFEKYLRGIDGEKQIDMDVDGTITGEYVTKEAIGGSDIVLTIDANLQEVTERALADCISNIRNGHYSNIYNATGGAAVVLDVNNGEVLAMASNPDYSPQLLYDGISNEQYADYNTRKVWSNKTIQGTYEPGSTYKMITAIAGLESGAINSTEKINDTGIYYSGKERKEFHCWYYDNYHIGHGPLNVVGALAGSCNYFFYETGTRAGIDEIAKYANHFGLGIKTGIELNGELPGLVASPATRTPWNPGDTLNASIGQGDNTFTLLQIAKYISMIANGGNNIDVSIIRNVLNSDGSTISDTEIDEFVKKQLNLTATSSDDDGVIVKPETIAIIKDGMRSVTEDRRRNCCFSISKFSN